MIITTCYVASSTGQNVCLDISSLYNNRKFELPDFRRQRRQLEITFYTECLSTPRYADAQLLEHLWPIGCSGRVYARSIAS